MPYINKHYINILGHYDSGVHFTREYTIDDVTFENIVVLNAEEKLMNAPIDG